VVVEFSVSDEPSGHCGNHGSEERSRSQHGTCRRVEQFHGGGENGSFAASPTRSQASIYAAAADFMPEHLPTPTS
jgi:hypothetical protein